MRRIMIAVSLTTVVLASGCATSQNVNLAQVSGGRPIATVAMVPSEGNSADMDAAVKVALLNQGLTAKAPLPAGTRKSPDVDMIASYPDQWRCDLVMYLRWVSIEMYDADSGNCWRRLGGRTRCFTLSGKPSGVSAARETARCPSCRRERARIE